MRTVSSPQKASSKKQIGKKVIVVALPVLSEGEIELVQCVRRNLSSLGEDFEVMVLSGGYEGTLRKLADRGDLAGALGEFMSPIWLEFLINKGVHIVQLGMGAEEKIPSVSQDINAVGNQAAQFLADSGVGFFAYLGPSGPSGSARLGESFSKSCLLRGHRISSSCELPGSVLKEFLHSLELPTGLLCATDRLARLAIIAAQESGLRIPQDIAIIGVGNSRMESLYAGIGISSFEIPFQEIGRKAGTLMAQLIRGIPIAERSVRIMATLHERESSMRSPSRVARALAHLRSNPGTRMNAGELARFSGMSRRAFENAVLAECGRSPGALLQEMRQSRAEKLLREGNLKIAEVCRECGYEEASVFSSAFRRWTGKSPREYQKKYTSTKC